MGFPPHAEIQIATIPCVGGDPGKRNPRSPHALDHLSSPLTFGLKARCLRNASLSAASGAVEPFLGQIEFAVDEGVSFRAHVTQEHPGLTLFNPSTRSALRLFHSCALF